MAAEPTIVIGKLDDKALQESIDKLLRDVDSKLNGESGLAGKFKSGIEAMQNSLNTFATTIKSVKGDVGDMSKSFEAMFKAMSSTGGSGAMGGGKGGSTTGGGTTTASAPNTIGELKEQIKLQGQIVDQQVRSTAEKERQVNKQRQLTNELEKELRSTAQSRLQRGLDLQPKGLGETKRALQYLQAVQRRYANTTQLSAQEQRNLANAITRTQREIAKINNTRPKTLKEVLGMDESSVDAITRKMRELKRVQLDTSDANQVKALSSKYQELAEKKRQYLGQNNLIENSNLSLARSFNYIRNRLVYAFSIGAILNFTKELYRVRGEYELLERSLGVLVNSFEQGTRIFQELNAMAIESPFTLMELAGAAKQLTAYNFAANEVVDTTRRLADISAALGVPMERLTYNLGQIRAQTVLNARDARDFANAGLPIVKSLSDYYSELEGKVVSTGDVYDRMSKKMVSYSDVMAVLNKMTDEGGKFFEFQAKQAQTLRVQMANLTLAWNNMLNELGKSNQTLLSLPLSALKSLLTNWESVNRVIKNLANSFGFLALAQMVAIKRNWELGKSATRTAGAMTILKGAVEKVKDSLKALALNPWTWVYVGIFAIADLIGQFRAAKQATEELNEEMRNNAQEASTSNIDFLRNSGNRNARELAKANKLTVEQGEKVWQGIEEQLNTTAMSANKLLGELLAIDDINERVRKGFDYTESIQKAQAALKDLQDDTIKLTNDAGWFGVFGEGLVSDLKDYYEDIKRGTEYMASLAGKTLDPYAAWLKNRNIRKEAGGDERYQFEQELNETAESINNFIKAHKITDPLQISEILERAKAIIKTKNPEIKGELATIFDISLDRRMSVLTKGAVDENATLWATFMERLKHNSSATFQDITEEWIKNDKEKLSPAQRKAIDENLAYFKNTMPMYYNAIANMVSDASQLKIQIGIAFNTQVSTDFQKQVRDRISKASGVLDFGSEAMLPTQNDNLTSWAKTQRDAIKKLRDENKDYEKDSTEWSKNKIKANNTEIEQRKNLLALFKQSDTEEKKSSKRSGGSKKDILGDALAKEVQLIGEIQKRYKEYQQMGVNAQEAIRLATEEYGNTLKRTNATLAKYGISTKTSEELAGMDIRDVRDYYKSLLEMAKSTGNAKGIEAIEKALANINVEITKLDYKKITDGLNNELSKLKDEYELALELDADPELGGIFEQLFDIDPSQLPRTVQEYSDMVTKALNEKLKEGEVGVELADLLGMRKGKVDEIVGSLPENSVWRDIITKAWKEIHEANKKAVTDAAKEWDKQVEKYGKLQDKLIRISKDGAQARFNVIKQFGSEEEKASSKTLIDNIMKEQDPQKIAVQMEELMKRVNAIIARNPNAKVVIDATINQTSKDISKAYWEDFKDSDLYSMTFENMSKNSTRAIQLIVDKLDLLKDKVKEDPASMKALTDSLNKAQDELVTRNPLKALVQSLGELKNARQGVKTATEALGTADGQVAYWEEQVKKLRDSGEDEKYIDAQDKLAKAKENQAKAQVNLAQAENRERTAKEKMVDSLDKTQQAMEATQGAFNALSNAFRAFGDDDTADMLGEIANGFAMIIPVVVAVAVAIKTLESTSVILLAISAALATIIGLVSWLSGRSDKKIVEQIKESERAVKRLENAYRNLEATTENVYGAMVSGAQKALQANKKLQLAELQRQLTLERSRDSKHRDEDRIAELEGQIQDLRNEIKKASQDIVNELLGVSSTGDGITSLVDAMIDAFRNGEDAMEAFSKKWDEMIDNMILKLMVSYYMQREWDKIMDTLKKMEDQFLEKASAEYEEAVREQNRFNNQEKWQQAEDYLRSTGLFNTDDSYERRIITNLGDYFEDEWVFGGASSEGMRRLAQIGITDYESFWEKVGEYQQGLVNDVKRAEEATNEASLKFTEWSYEYMKGEGYDRMKSAAENLYDNISQFYTFGQDNEKELSALQRGIQGITEETAGALEAITNGISQQCYLQSDLLTQIRDTVQSFDIDVQTSTFAEMLLQLQISTQTQNAIRSIMEGWSSPNGMSVRVEMI